MTTTTVPIDRRSLRTRRALRDALLSLLPERGWDGVRVQDLCERADVGRSTFYLHFQNKDELLVGSMSDLRAWLAEQASRAGEGGQGSLLFARGLIEHVDEQRMLFRSIIGRRSSQFVQARFKEMVLRLVKDDLGPSVPKGWEADSAIHFVAAGLVEVLAWWVDTSSARSVDELEGHFHQLSRSIVDLLTADRPGPGNTSHR